MLKSLRPPSGLRRTTSSKASRVSRQNTQVIEASRRSPRERSEKPAAPTKVPASATDTVSLRPRGPGS